MGTIAIIGCGGIGSSLLPLVTRMMLNTKISSTDSFLSGSAGCSDRVNKLVLIDGDTYEARNISRQQFPLSFVGINKAYAQKEKLKVTLGLGDRVVSIGEYINPENIHHHLEGVEVVLSCVDNHRARWVVSQWAQLQRRRGKPFAVISGGNDQFDGNVHVHACWPPQRGLAYIDIGEPIEKRHPEIMPDATEGSREGLSCQDVINLRGGEQTMMANSMAAVVMFSAMYTLLMNTKALVNVQDMYFDCLNYRFNVIRADEKEGVKELSFDAPPENEAEPLIEASDEGTDSPAPPEAPVIHSVIERIDN